MSLLDHLDQDTLKKILNNAIAAGVVDKNTLNPVESKTHEAVLSHGGTFEVPAECDRAQYLSEGGYGVVCKCRVLNPKRYHGCTDIAVKKVSLPHEKAFDSEWEDNIRLLREIHFMKHLPHPNITPIVSIYMNKEARGESAAAEDGGSDAGSSARPSASSSSAGNIEPKMKSKMKAAAGNSLKSSSTTDPATEEEENLQLLLRKNLKCFYIVMPLYTPGSLDTMGIISDERQFCGIMRDCVSGLLWMHRHKVLHRDIKRENIFYDALNQNAVIADLGMARSTKKKMTGGRECSTKSYLAPELIMETTESYSYPVDIWALGCVFYEMLLYDDEGASMFSESNPYHLILARQYSINKCAFGTKLSRKRITLGPHNIQQLATQEASWVKKRWVGLEKQLEKFTAGWVEGAEEVAASSGSANGKKTSLSDREKSGGSSSAKIPAKPWDPSMKPFLIEDVIKKCLQFYPEERCTASELAESLNVKKNRCYKLVGPCHMPKRVKQSTVTENFFEQISKLKTDKARGMAIRRQMYELTLSTGVDEGGSGEEEGEGYFPRNPFVNVHSDKLPAGNGVVRTSLGPVASGAAALAGAKRRKLGLDKLGGVVAGLSSWVTGGGRDDLGKVVEEGDADMVGDDDRELLVLKPTTSAGTSMKRAVDHQSGGAASSGNSFLSVAMAAAGNSSSAGGNVSVRLSGAETPKSSPRTKAKAQPKPKAKTTAAAKRRNQRKAFAMPTIDEDGDEEEPAGDRDLQEPVTSTTSAARRNSAKQAVKEIPNVLAGLSRSSSHGKESSVEGGMVRLPTPTIENLSNAMGGLRMNTPANSGGAGSSSAAFVSKATGAGSSSGAGVGSESAATGNGNKLPMARRNSSKEKGAAGAAAASGGTVFSNFLSKFTSKAESGDGETPSAGEKGGKNPSNKKRKNSAAAANEGGPAAKKARNSVPRK
eukprot:g6355.t1